MTDTDTQVQSASADTQAEVAAPDLLQDALTDPLSASAETAGEAVQMEVGGRRG